MYKNVQYVKTTCVWINGRGVQPQEEVTGLVDPSDSFPSITFMMDSSPSGTDRQIHHKIIPDT